MNKLLYLFTEFPAPTETFYQREVRALHALDKPFELWSLWRGQDTFNGQPVHLFNKWLLATVPLALAYWTARRPRAVGRFFRALLARRPPDVENVAQTLLGAAFAVIHARRFERAGFDHIHAAWANMPATAALCLHQLIDLPFSTGAHAYDIYRNGGDWLLDWKLRDAAAVTTSSGAARDTLLERGAAPARLHLIRRGLDTFLPCRAPREGRQTLRALSIGRLVEKKGYDFQLEGYAAYRDRAGGALPLEARVVGEGGGRAHLGQLRDSLALNDAVTLTGSMPFDDVLEEYARADVFVFTGRIARDGNRDGFPNVLGEALAAGLPVIATPVSAVGEAIVDGATGLLLDPDDPVSLARALQRLATDPGLYERLRRNGRAWVEEHFDANRNASQLWSVLEQAAASTSARS